MLRFERLWQAIVESFNGPRLEHQIRQRQTPEYVKRTEQTERLSNTIVGEPLGST
jgi:hypothetical protein